MTEISNYKFILLDKNRCSEVLELFKKYNISPKAEFVTWDDYAVMSMVEQGLGVSILPRLILNKVPFDIEIKRFKKESFRILGIVYKDQKLFSNATSLFLKDLEDSLTST